MLNKDEFIKCLASEQLAELRISDEDAVKVFEMTNKDEEHLVTFADYLYFRRVNIAWGDCAAGT